MGKGYTEWTHPFWLDVLMEGERIQFSRRAFKITFNSLQETFQIPLCYDIWLDIILSASRLGFLIQARLLKNDTLKIQSNAAER